MVIVMNNLAKVSLLILTERKKHGWSQQKLADYTGLNRTTIGAIERDDYSDIGIRKIERILNVFHKSLTTEHRGLPTLDELQVQNKRGY